VFNSLRRHHCRIHSGGTISGPAPSTPTPGTPDALTPDALTPEQPEIAMIFAGGSGRAVGAEGAL
jgi:hypothetical protein